MGAFARGLSRRSLLVTGLSALPLLGAEGPKGASFSSEITKYPDPSTEWDVFRLTDPAHASVLPAYYNRALAKSGAWILFASDRSGSMQATRLDLKTGVMRQLTEAQDLDPATLTHTPDNRSFCYFGGRSLYIASLSTLRERELYRVPDGWERGVGMSVGADGTHALFVEQQGEKSRLRMVSLVQGPARTVIDAPFAISDPLARPMRAQILYRQGAEALWLVNADGQQNHVLKTAPGQVGEANWANDGKTVLYLNIPEDRTQLNAIWEQTPDANTTKLVAKTSQFTAFGFNHDSSVFVGASRNTASPTVLILLRVTRRELTVCEHKSSRPETVNPIFSPDSQRIYFQSDRHGKPALYSLHVEKLVEKTDALA